MVISLPDSLLEEIGPDTTKAANFGGHRVALFLDFDGRKLRWQPVIDEACQYGHRSSPFAVEDRFECLSLARRAFLIDVEPARAFTVKEGRTGVVGCDHKHAAPSSVTPSMRPSVCERGVGMHTSLGPLSSVPRFRTSTGHNMSQLQLSINSALNANDDIPPFGNAQRNVYCLLLRGTLLTNVSTRFIGHDLLRKKVDVDKALMAEDQVAIDVDKCAPAPVAARP